MVLNPIFPALRSDEQEVLPLVHRSLRLEINPLNKLDNKLKYRSNVRETMIAYL